MSWSVSALAKRDEALKIVREQLANAKGNYLKDYPGEVERAEKILDTIDAFAATSVDPGDMLKVGAWGSEVSLVATGKITAIQGGYNVIVEPHPIPQPVEAAPQAGSPTAG